VSLGGQVQAAGTQKRAVRLVLLHDVGGKVLALLPSDRLLNLAALWSLTGRRLQAVRREGVKRFFGQRGLQTEVGQRGLMQSLPLLIDQTLKEGSELSLSEYCTGFRFDWRYECGNEQQVTLGDISLQPATATVQQAPRGHSDVSAISSAVERFTALRVQQRLEDTLGLPALAPTTQQIIRLRSKPDAGVDELVQVVRLDPSLSAQVMSWAASPYYAAPGEVRSIDDAIIRVLGFDLVVNLALGIAMGKVLRVPEDQPSGTMPYWRQAVYAATLAEVLARKMPLQLRLKTGLAYLSGLLHNFGYLVLAHLFQPHFSLLSRYIEANPHLEPVLIEQQVLKVTRDQIGGWLLESWSLPSEVCAAIRQQQLDAPEGEAGSYARLLRLTVRLLRREGLADGPVEPIETELLQCLGLTTEQTEEAMSVLLSSRDNLNQLTHALSRERI